MNQPELNRPQSKRVRRSIVAGTLLLAGLGLVAGVSAVAPRIPALAEGDSATSKTFDLPIDTTLSVHHRHGSVTVLGWDRPEVQLNVKLASPQHKAAASALRFAPDRDTWALNTDLENVSDDPNMEMHIVLRVPRGTPLDLDVKNGAIAVSGLEAPVTLATGNGSISCHDLAGEVKANTRNGNIECRYVQGQIKARTGNGKILVDESHGLGARPLDLVSENGTVRVVLPEDAGFELDAHAQQGRVRSEFRPDAMQGFGLRRIVGVVSGGGPGILLRALNGTVRIERG